MSRSETYSHSAQNALPNHRGEREFATQILQCLPKEAKIWFNLQLPGCKEIDALLLHPEHGCLLIEVKSKPLAMVKHFNLYTCELEGQGSMLHPLKQALQAVYPLKQRIEDYGFRAPWIRSTAAMPVISRENFTKKFNPHPDEKSAIGDQISGMIFSEDLRSSQHFEDLLQRLVKTPPIGSIPSKVKFNFEETYRCLSKVFETEQISSSSEPSTQPAKLIGQFQIQPRKPRKDTIRSFTTPGQRGAVVINGLPGAGKTQALLDIAVSHAEAGRNALFVCYNKVLATRFRQDMDALETVSAETKGRVLIADIYDLYTALNDEFMKATYAKFFETICVDESQDLYHLGERRDLLELIDDVVADHAEWFYAYGRDQELYGTAPERVRQALQKPENVQELRRPARSATDSFRESVFSQVGFNYSFDPARAETAAKEMLRRIQGDETLSDSTYRQAIQSIQVTKISRSTPVEEYEKLLSDELQKVEELGAPRDLMLLFPRTDRDATGRELVVQALKGLKVPYLDQVIPANRRERLQPGHVRLVTVHSSRGLQATRTILFAPHLITTNLQNDDATVWNSTVPYIALSRAMNGTHIVEFSDEDPSPFQNYVNSCREAYGQQLLQQLMGI
ncbi:NERD domain-containing protein [Rothia nasisuis]|uniref:NERD domain-containing protein n=1 Tax=Rothia nasisuis TaxID=2109647 RepID=UPI001F32ACE9|nr:NERD domain-containing protein [Rothia nasisuis]